MKMRLGCFAVFAFVVICSAGMSAQQRLPGPAPGVQGPGGLVTLYAFDPFSHALCFRDGEAGLTAQQHQLRNRCSDIDFDTYTEGGFTVGIEGGRVGTIVDIGTDEFLKQKYGYMESSLARGQGFVTLHVDNGKLMTLKDLKAGTVQEMTESDALFAEGKTLATAPVRVGHIYLVRTTDKYDKSFQSIVKILVLAYIPNTSVTIRWQTL
jgi:hypothetical protein